jgi:hypothetical protein
MKTRNIPLAALFVLILLIPGWLHAQMAIRQPMMQVDVPFAFVAGGVHLPPGHYYVYHPGDPFLVVIEKDDGRARAMEYVHPSPTKPGAASTKLVFNKYGEQYFLSQVWTEPDQEVHDCLKCRTEKALMAQNPKPEPVVLLGKR